MAEILNEHYKRASIVWKCVGVVVIILLALLIYAELSETTELNWVIYRRVVSVLASLLIGGVVLLDIIN